MRRGGGRSWAGALGWVVGSKEQRKEAGGSKETGELFWEEEEKKKKRNALFWFERKNKKIEEGRKRSFLISFIPSFVFLCFIL